MPYRPTPAVIGRRAFQTAVTDNRKGYEMNCKVIWLVLVAAAVALAG